MSPVPLHFAVHDERLAIVRLEPTAAMPTWVHGGFVNIARTPRELSIVCAQQHVPADATQERDKIAFGIVGVVPMTTIGLLAALCSTLAAAQIPVFVISTYDTDYLLVSAPHFTITRAALLAAGHQVTGNAPG